MKQYIPKLNEIYRMTVGDVRHMRALRIDDRPVNLRNDFALLAPDHNLVLVQIDHEANNHAKVIYVQGEKHEPSPLPVRNENCLDGMRCPQCGSLGPLRISVKTILMFEDDGTDICGDNEYDDDSHCSCENCGWWGTTADFKDKAFYKSVRDALKLLSE
jgi:hypothetical protein